jgi:hypothetical protein
VRARTTAGVTVEAGTCQITVEPGITISAPRTTSSDIRRHKASNYDWPAYSDLRQPAKQA